MPNDNREHKSTIFADLFYTDQYAKENLLSLYNALYDTSYEDTKLIELVRLEDVVFRNFKNDLAFTLKGQEIILSEHQSTGYPNIPLRYLMYIGREYEKLIPVRKRFSRNMIQMPYPRFVTFYNGKEDSPQEQVLKLSDAFFPPDVPPESTEPPTLELSTRVININLEKQHPILQKCSVLYEYSQFISIVRECIANHKDLGNAVKECIRRGILKDYLERKGSEVINVLTMEYDYDMDIAVQREEATEKATQAADHIWSFILQNPNASVEEIVQKTGVPEDRVRKIQEILAMATASKQP